MVRELEQLYRLTGEIRQIEIRIRHNSDVDLFKLHQAQRYLGYFINETADSEEFQKELQESNA